MALWIWLIAIFGAISLGVYLFIRKRGQYWKRRGFFYVGSETKGNLILNIFRKVPFTELDKRTYKKLKAECIPYCGMTEVMIPVLFVADLDLLKRIFVKDFDNFFDRQKFILGGGDDEENKYLLSKMLFFLEGEEWKELRTKMTPIFTTGKIKRNFEIFRTSCLDLMKYLHEKVGENGDEVDLVDSIERYALDVIASSAFGLNAMTFIDKTPVFQVMAKKFQLELGIKAMLTIIFAIIFPRVAKALGLDLRDKPTEDFFTKVIMDAIKHRDLSGEKREDFLQLMIDLKNGQIETTVDEKELDRFEKEAELQPTATSGTTMTTETTKKKKDLITDDIIVAQSVLFILAGFDTTQSFLAFALYELALNPDVQDKVVEEIEGSLNENDGQFTYESINRLEYLEKVAMETLRKYPAVPRLTRTTMQDYKIPDTELVVPKGTVIAIPTLSFHHDERYFPNPSQFNPENFSPENKNARHPYAFQTFGHGPRNCIGMRFALSNSKMAIANIVNNFIIEPSKKTTIPMEYSLTGVLKPKNGMFLKLTPRH